MKNDIQEKSFALETIEACRQPRDERESQYNSTYIHCNVQCLCIDVERIMIVNVKAVAGCLVAGELET